MKMDSDAVRIGIVKAKKFRMFSFHKTIRFTINFVYLFLVTGNKTF